MHQKLTEGYTLLEMLIVVAIIGILATLIVPKLMHYPEQARVVKAKQDIQTLENALALYKLDNGFYPSTSQGLTALTNKPTTAPVPQNWHPYLKKLRNDPWGHAYHYQNPGVHGEIDIFTDGSGQHAQASDKNQVIGNWTLG